MTREEAEIEVDQLMFLGRFSVFLLDPSQKDLSLEAIVRGLEVFQINRQYFIGFGTPVGNFGPWSGVAFGDGRGIGFGNGDGNGESYIPFGSGKGEGVFSGKGDGRGNG